MRRTLLFPALVAASCLAPAVSARPGAFDADFRKDPARQGFTATGADDGRFEWTRPGLLTIHLDSNAEAARLAAPLGFQLDGSDSFRVEVDVTLLDVEASPDDFFQISFGLANAATTGLNRTGTALAGPPFFVDDSDVFDSLELAYFPNVTSFGGPFLQPTVFGAETGSAFANFAANFGPSSDLGDNGPDAIRELPLGVPLRVVLEHDACRHALVTTIFDLSSGRPVELATGLELLDLASIEVTGTFVVDALAFNAYRDLADFDPSTRSLSATLEVAAARVERRDAPSARLLPRAEEASPRAGARALVRDAGDGPARLVESAGLPVDVPLESRSIGAGLLVELPAGLAVAPLSIAVGSCVVPVDAP